MIRALRQASVPHKLTLIILLTSAAAMLAAALIAFGYEWVRSRRALVDDLAAQAEIIGANSAVALAFGDLETAREVLQGLSARPDIVYACLYTTDGEAFAEYRSARGGAPSLSPPVVTTPVQRFEKGSLVLFRPLKLGNDPAGVICLQGDLRRLRTLLLAYAGIVFIVVSGLLLLSLVLARPLQRLIADPILRLADLARRVTRQQDYSLRAPRQSDDEIGELTDGVNQMLAHIQERDQKLHRAYDDLQSSEQRFRQLAGSITQVFWLTDVDKNEMLYVSPAYETIWGRSCASLYRSPRNWLEAIHPDDRDRVIKAALTKQATGDYDEEYRVVTPTGATRWIRDRGFPIYDENGHVYRIGGIAEDITHQKRLEGELLEITERERSRIGQDLHDGLCQHLVSTAFSATFLERKLATQSLPEAAAAGNIAQLLDEAITQARTLARGLYPVGVERAGLAPALQELANSVSRQPPTVSCRLECPQPVSLTNPIAGTHLYRIAQEAIRNAVKHGQATEIIIGLTQHDGQVILSVDDNGRGLPPQPTREDSMGIHIMQYRAGMLGGTLELGPRAGGGTRVRCACRPPASANGGHNGNHQS